MDKVEFMGLSACLYLLGCLECWLSTEHCAVLGTCMYVHVSVCQCQLCVATTAILKLKCKA